MRKELARSEILVLGGVHGNEPFGSALVQSLCESSISGIDALIANERAVKEGVRFIDNELSVDSNPNGSSYEDGRFAKLVKECQEYRLILDFHNASYPTAYEAWIHPPSETLKQPIQWLLGKAAIRYVVKFDQRWSLYTALPQTILIEQGLPEQGYVAWEKQRIERWRSILMEMAKTGLSNLQAESPKNLTFLEETESIGRRWAKQNNLGGFTNLQRYDDLPSEVAASLGVKAENRKILSWGYQNMSKPIPGVEGEREYWGGLARETEPFL